VFFLVPQRDYKYGVILMRSIASQFLSPPDQSKRPYDFIFAKIPHDVREEREAFFRKSGYNYDSSICILSLKDSSKEKTVKFHIQTAVKVGSSVEGIFTAYAIESLHSKTTVLKRYRDFIRLRKKLQLFVGDAKVPKLPKKRLFGSTDIEELNKQKEKLETWLNGVAAIPQAIVLVEDFMKDDLLPKKKKKITEEEKLLEILKKNENKAVPGPTITRGRTTSFSPIQLAAAAETSATNTGKGHMRWRSESAPARRKTDE